MTPTLSCFKAYDIRGRVPEELNVDIAYRLGIAYAEMFQPKRVALGRDVRDSGPSLQMAIAQGLASRGVEPMDIGLCGTEEIYFAAVQDGIDGGIMVTASHNPLGYNGMKLVRGGAIPISGDSGLRDLERAVATSTENAPNKPVEMTPVDYRPAYASFLASWIEADQMPTMSIVTNPGNGTAGQVIDRLEPYLPFEFFKCYHQPDGKFPHGIPNPLLTENRAATTRFVREHKPDFGVAWDGDFDRCFFFDETGEFVEGYYLVGLLAEAMLRREPGAKIIHDPRLTWNTLDIVQRNGGIPVQSKTGHAFIKERMRAENAIYGGEMSAHHYFREFAYCDNGNIPWLLVAALVAETGKPLSQLIAERKRAFPISGEINRTVSDIQHTLAQVEDKYSRSAVNVDRTDGISIDYPDWRFNLRGSNTEPVLRLNVESRGDQSLMEAKTKELLETIGGS